MSYFRSYFASASNVISGLVNIAPEVEKVASIILGVLRDGGTIYICGNGGSASDSQHIAAELIGRFRNNRKPLPALALNTDTSAITAIANDFGYDQVFARQLEGLASSKDILIAISTSGNSKNIINVLKTARNLGIVSILLTGNDGGVAKNEADFVIVVNSTETSHIQECHITIGQAICGYIESHYL